MDRTILHCDLNAFYASVESVFKPQLKGVPMAVAGNPKHRHGIILAKNQLAKEAGVKTAETIWQAKKKCPGLILVPPQHDEYARYSRLVNDIYQEFTDLVEPFGIDESWLDVTGVLHLFGDGRTLADRIRQTVKERLDLTLSVGVSFNKIFAKLGSDYKKPDATTLIAKGNYQQMLWPLPVSRLLFVGKVTQETLARIGISTIGQLAAVDKEGLVSLLGKTGGMLHDYANGRDDSPVRSAYADQDLKSVGNGTTFDHNLVGYQEILSGIMPLCDEVAARMRKYGVKCQVLSVQIKDPRFKTFSRQKTLPSPTHLTREIADTAMELIRSSWKENAPVRSITVTGSNLVASDQAVEQLSFFEGESKEDRQRYEKLDETVDQIRKKFGKGAIGLGGSIRSEEDP